MKRQVTVGPVPNFFLVHSVRQYVVCCMKSQSHEISVTGTIQDFLGSYYMCFMKINYFYSTHTDNEG